MDWHRLLCRPLYIILSYIYTEIHPALSLDNECRVDFSCVHLLKVSGNNIPFCYVMIITFVSCSSVILIQLHQFSCIVWKWQTPTWCANCAEDFFGVAANLAIISHIFFLIYHVLPVCSTVSNGTICPKFFHLYAHYFSVRTWHIQKFLCEFTMA